MYKIYHGCGLVNFDGTRKLIKFRRGERCTCATDKRFCKRPQDCTNVGVKTRAAVNKDRLNKASLLYRKRYFPKLEQENDN